MSLHRFVNEGQSLTIHRNTRHFTPLDKDDVVLPVDAYKKPRRAGECGFCRSQLLSGEIFVSPISDGRRMMDKEMGWFHPCSSWPLTDLKIKIPIL
ncbi:MAG: hypothetical protein II451_05445 [Oscillospiraceae bacterium]|nr:hypothetical protein [Oscillospiraceae bacterium]